MRKSSFVLGLLVLSLAVSVPLQANAVDHESMPWFTQAYHFLKGPIDCVKQNTSLACDLMDKCVWCIGSSVGTGCYPTKLAHILPKKYFECDKPVAAAEEVETIDAGENATCDKESEAACIGPACVWCTSAAVGGGCYTPEQAKLLPKAIFKCKDAPSP